MSDDLQCPYCQAAHEVCHDDGFGYDEGVPHEMECSDCEKTFVFHTHISFDYEPEKAPCLNGGAHDMGQVYCSFYPDWIQCKICGHENRGEYQKEPWVAAGTEPEKESHTASGAQNLVDAVISQTSECIVPNTGSNGQNNQVGNHTPPNPLPQKE